VILVYIGSNTIKIRALFVNVYASVTWEQGAAIE